MADAESIRQIAHSRAPLSTWLGVVLLFSLFGVIVLAVIGPLPRSSDYEETRAKKRIETLKTVREEAEKSLATYAWVDKSKGVARVPISRAMELTTAELATQKPAPAGPIATPQEQAQPSPASPAPAGSPKAGATQPAGSPSTTVPAAGAAPVSPAAASPSAQTPASPAPAAQTSPAATASPAPAQTP